MLPRPHDDRFTHAKVALGRLLDRAQRDPATAGDPLGDWFGNASAAEQEAGHAFLSRLCGVVVRTLILAQHQPDVGDRLVPVLYELHEDQAPPRDAIDPDDSEGGYPISVPDVALGSVLDDFETYVLRTIAASANDDTDTADALYQSLATASWFQQARAFYLLFRFAYLLTQSDPDATPSYEGHTTMAVAGPAASAKDFWVGWILASSLDLEETPQ